VVFVFVQEHLWDDLVYLAISVDDLVQENFLEHGVLNEFIVVDGINILEVLNIVVDDLWFVDKEGLDDFVQNIDVMDRCVQTEIKFPIVNTGGVVSVVDDWVDVLVEKIRVTEEGCENFLSPVLLEVRGGQVQLEEWVAEVLTEEGKGVISLEQWVADDFVKAQSIDSVDGIDVEGVSGAIDILPHTDSMIPLQETSLVVKGLSSNASCEQCDCDESLHDTR